MANVKANFSPRLQPLLRYFFSYLLFALFGLLGVVVLVNLHAAIVSTGSLVSGRYGVAPFLNTWGFFFLLGAYFVGIVLIENTMHKAARTGEIFKRGVRVFAVEGGLALLAVIVPPLARFLMGIR